MRVDLTTFSQVRVSFHDDVRVEPARWSQYDLLPYDTVGSDLYVCAKCSAISDDGRWVNTHLVGNTFLPGIRKQSIDVRRDAPATRNTIAGTDSAPLGKNPMSGSRVRFVGRRAADATDHLVPWPRVACRRGVWGQKLLGKDVWLLHDGCFENEIPY